MKIATSVTVFRDALGMRMSYTYSEIDDETGRIITDNNRGNRIVTDADMISDADALIAYAQAGLGE